MKDFAAFDSEIQDIEKEHFSDLYQPLKKYFTILVDLNDKCQVVWEDSTCPKHVRDKVIYAYRLLP